MGNFLAVAFGLFLVVAVVALLLALPTMLLWNAVVPDITKGALTELTFWQALGVNLLCGMLFKTTVNTNKD